MKLLKSRIVNEENIKMSENNLQPLMACIVLVVIIVLKIWGLAKSPDLIPAGDPFYTIRHIAFLLVWVSLLNFFYNQHLFFKYESMLLGNIKSQSRASLMASVACLIKGVWTLVHTILTTSEFNSFTAYYLAEVLVWLILARYLFGSYREFHHLIKDLKREEYEG